MVGFPNKPMGFPTKNDHHLGCEMGGKTHHVRKHLCIFLMSSSWIYSLNHLFQKHKSPKPQTLRLQRAAATGPVVAGAAVWDTQGEEETAVLSSGKDQESE